MKLRTEVDEIAAEFDGVALGDERLDERLRRIAALVAGAPSDSFPEQMQTVADREALYRFLSNPKVTLDGILDGHFRQTHERLRGRSTVRVVHDTTNFKFNGERDGLETLLRGAKGFLGHFALAVEADDAREPLGVLGVETYMHDEVKTRRKMTQNERVKATLAKPRSEKESSRWERLASEASRGLPPGVRPVHVMDQEADDYDVFAALKHEQLAFVIRANPERRTGADRVPTSEVVHAKPAEVFRTVWIGPRDGKKSATTRNRHPPRSEREARLKIRWAPITLLRGQHNEAEARELSLWAVHVFEPEPPKGEAAIEWMLFTSEPVTNLAEATVVVDHYRARWLIEEYFKALKTGCAFERRQLMTFDGLVRALAIFIPMAWRLLMLRHLGRDATPRPASKVLNDEQLALLRALLSKRNYKLSAKPSVRDAMLGVAALGGHITNHGDPGWLVLGRGFTRFVEAEEVWTLARAAM